MEVEMFKKLIFVVASIAIIATGCSLFNFGGEDLIPLSVGNYWNYKMTYVVDSNNVVFWDTTMHYREEIINEVTLPIGEKAFAFKIGNTNSSYDFDTTGTWIYYISKEDSAYLEYDSTSQLEGNYYLPKNIEVGTGWYYDEDTKNEVVAKENVIVPAGTFENAYKIAMTYTTSNDTFWMWVAPGYGIIKQYLKDVYTYDSTTFSYKYTYELTGYKVE